ncbi:MAG: M1 family metallopeptidase [Bacteroidota bacterium]|nr:M1 family metallopeptidase [Bacteroidota bacterium]
MKKIFILILLLSVISPTVFSQSNPYKRKFEQLDTELPTPNVYRTGSGAPGHQYWQQKADYDIEVELDEDKHIINGSEKITYTNNSPDQLKYLWLQLDQNMRAKDSDTYSIETNKIPDSLNLNSLKEIIGHDFDGGHKIKFVKDAQGKDISYTINKTMMRLDLSQPLNAGATITFSVAWSYNINDRKIFKDRGGFESFPDGNTLYTMAQWFPRMAVYIDYQGWQHKQFLGRGEFTLPFGDYKVKMTVPADHIVASTGVLQNPQDVLGAKEIERFEQSKSASEPVIIVNQKEVEIKEKGRAKNKKTWVYHAENVRDFAWGSSRKYIWDAIGVDINGKKVMAMSYYPKEANPLYEQFSTRAVAHTLKVYSKYTIDYPYPVAISVEADNGMEYPMICFNYGRPEKDGTYSPTIKHGMISVIIHEVGHNFFPMIINSDERQWTWMDEGLNTFLQYLAEQEWDRNYPSRRGPPSKIVPYMKGNKEGQRPIMTNSEQILQFGNNAYGKPATALNILRETVMGRELFDYAFKEYSQRWAFKHPTPADFFRTMEDASAVDLDWFWKGWFYTTDHVDISLENVRQFLINTKNPEIEKPIAKQRREEQEKNISAERNKEEIPQTAVERSHSFNDFYNSYDDLKVTEKDKKAYKDYLASLSEEERKMLNSKQYFYEITLKNIGGLVMPIILEFVYEDGTSEVQRIPAEIWRLNENQVTKVFAKSKPVASIVLDPYQETADTDVYNNFYPRREVPSRFKLYKEKQGTSKNPMQRLGE